MSTLKLDDQQNTSNSRFQISDPFTNTRREKSSSRKLQASRPSFVMLKTTNIDNNSIRKAFNESTQDLKNIEHSTCGFRPHITQIHQVWRQRNWLSCHSTQAGQQSKTETESQPDLLQNLGVVVEIQRKFECRAQTKRSPGKVRWLFKIAPKARKKNSIH